MLLPGTVLGAGGKPKVTFSLHLQISPVVPAEKAMTVNLIRPPIPITVSRTAELTERNIVGAEPYPALPGAVLITFDDHGRRVLNVITTANRGLRMVILVNGRPIFAPAIDATLPNGKILIPEGFTASELEYITRMAKKNRKR